MLYIESTVLSTQMAGHFWWRRWSDPREAALLFVENPDGGFEDHLLDGEVLDREIDEWEHGQFHDAQGEVTYALTWLTMASPSAPGKRSRASGPAADHPRGQVLGGVIRERTRPRRSRAPFSPPRRKVIEKRLSVHARAAPFRVAERQSP